MIHFATVESREHTLNLCEEDAMAWAKGYLRSRTSVRVAHALSGL